jgi:hypothetical protein
MSGGILQSDIEIICKNYLPLVVTNLPGQALTAADLDKNGNLTLGGWAPTNSLAIAGIKGVPIANVFWRVSESGSGFQGVTRKNLTTNPVSWSTDFAPQSGTNTFESYVQYANGANSWTNNVRFVYNGPVAISLSRASTYFAQGSNAGFVLGGVGAASGTYVLLAASNCVPPMSGPPSPPTPQISKALSASQT